MRSMQKGVSLIAVLLFMLVATIAGTATYKWLSSEGYTSASRLLINQARASALAGVDAARSWMSSHGNETGAIVKQFFERNKKPIILNSVLASMGKETQGFDVYLVGVDFNPANPVYKMKILSKGYVDGRDVSYTESAVLNVTGLYQVRIPQEQQAVNYSYAYFGGSTSYSGTHHVSAMLINGDWGGTNGANPGYFDSDFIVTGNVRLSGNNMNIGGTTCVGGNLVADNGFWGNDLYVDGFAHKDGNNGNDFVGQIARNAYFNGNVTIGNQANPGFDIQGSMTLNATLRTQVEKFGHSIHGNLCLGRNARIEFDNTQNSWGYNWLVGGNVWIPTSKEGPSETGIVTHDDVNDTKRVFGGNSSSKLYIADAEVCASSCPSTDKPTKQKHTPGNTVSSFVSNGDIFTELPNKAPFECAESVKAYCDTIWHRVAPHEKKCGHAKYKVDDLLKIGYSQFEEYANIAANSSVNACKNLTSFRKDDNNGNTRDMNNCWDSLMANATWRSTYLFNDYLVLKLSYGQNDGSLIDGSDKTQLNGKFIFIFENPLPGEVHFPRTTATTRAFVYLMEGVSQKLHCSTPDTYNYFIFTEKNIAEMDGSCTWSGSVYAKVDTNCAAVPTINGNITLEYNQSLIEDMVNSGIVCTNDHHPEKPCPVGADEQGSSSSTVNNNFSLDLFDVSHISTGTRLNVTVESEYKSDERIKEAAETVKPSILVLPRVVYINRDAPGYMKDYLSVIPLNGFPVIQNQPKLSCPGQPGAPEMSATKKISTKVPTQGVYNCIAEVEQSGKKDTSLFYVYVAGEAASTPMVHFSGEPAHDFHSGETNSAVLSVVVGPSESGAPVLVSISMTDLPNGWTVTNLDNSQIVWHIGNDGSRSIQKTFTPSATEETVVQLFKVGTGNNPISGTVRFTLHSPQGCIIGGGAVVKAYNIQGHVTIHRASLAQYCAKYPDKCDAHPEYKEAKDLQDCDAEGIWVRANGVGCNPITGYENDRWLCDAGVGAANHIVLTKGEYRREYCELYIPTEAEKNYIEDPKDDNVNPGGDTLYASLKRKHYTLTIKTRYASAGSAVRVDTSSTFGSGYHQLGTLCSSSKGCSYTIYAGQTVRLEAVPQGDDEFKYWEDGNSNSSNVQINVSPYEFMISRNETYTAVFNEKDPHCFYTEFKEYTGPGIWCSDDRIKCIDHCNSSTTCNVGDGPHQKASWIEINSNGVNAKPAIIQGGYIKNNNAEPAIIMNTVDAGPNGVFTARIRTGMLPANDSHNDLKYLNSGIVVRAKQDMSEYISVHFFGTNSSGRENASATGTHVRVCYSNTRIKTGSDHCAEVSLVGVSPNPIQAYNWSTGEQLNFSITVRGDSLYVGGSYAQGNKVREIEGALDLNDVVQNGGNTLNDEQHHYVGIKLEDNPFGVYDASWHSDLFSDQCFDEPAVFCSFATKYLGGEVPLNESVTPAIGYSDWFKDEGKECTNKITYFYNGCDQPSSSYKNSLGAGIFNNWNMCKNNVCGEGAISNFLAQDGLELKNNTEYRFSCEGKHGFEHLNPPGYVRSASVKVDCRLVNGRVYTSKCGEFYVGRRHSCRQDEHFVTTAVDHGIEDVVIEIPGENGANLRESNIMFGMSLGNNVSMKAWLEDVNGVVSDAVGWRENGPYLVSFEKFSDRYGFNPEKVKKIRLKGSGNYTIDSIASYCMHSLKVYCGANDAVYSGNSWRITANIDPFESAKKCKVVSYDGKVAGTYFGDCNSQGLFTLQDPNFMNRINENRETSSYEFEVSVYDDPNATVNSEPVSTCIAGSQAYAPTSANCELAGENRVFPQGVGVPAAVVEAVNCPEDGCRYKLTLVGAGEFAHSDKISGAKTWDPPSINRLSPLTTGSYHYEFRLFSPDSSKQYDACSSPSFDVVAASPARAENCGVTNDHFIANVIGSNYEQVNATLVRTSWMGNPTQNPLITVGVNSTGYVDYDLSSLSQGYYVLTLKLNGDSACSVLYTAGNPSAPELDVDCPTQTITDQSPSSGISVSPTVTGCEGKCNWEVVEGTSGNTGSNYNTGSVTFYDANGSDTKTYTFKVTRSVFGQTATGQCTFKVSFASTSSSYCSVPPTLAFANCHGSEKNFNYSLNTTNAVCLKIHGNIGGWGCSNCNGRTWRINGGNPTTSTSGSITATSDGYSYIDLTAGTYTYAQPYGYNISCP